MSRYSRLPAAAPDERGRHFSSIPAQTFFELESGHGEESYCKGAVNGKIINDVSRHRRVISASEISLHKLRDGQMLDKQSLDESMPDLFFGTPLEDLDESERQTWKTQWADALKKVQSLRHSGSGTQSERWSGIATDIFRPKSLETQNAYYTSKARTSNATAASLDQWNFYPGPSVNRDIPQLQLDNRIRGNENAGADVNAWNSSLLDGATPNRENNLFRRSTTENLLQGHGTKSIRTLEKLDFPLEVTQRNIIDNDTVPPAHQGRGSTEHIVANSKQQVFAHQTSDSGHGLTAPSLDQFNESQRPKSFSALASRVQRTQSHRYGRMSGCKPEANHLLEMAGKNSSAYSNAAVPNPILKKAISMREGGAHADAVMEMARAYTDTVCGVPKTLECASCGRSLGIIVQGNPGVDIAFCQACRPSPLQWKKPTTSDNAAGFKKKKNGIVQFCRKILRLDKKSSRHELAY